MPSTSLRRGGWAAEPACASLDGVRACTPGPAGQNGTGGCSVKEDRHRTDARHARNRAVAQAGCSVCNHMVLVCTCVCTPVIVAGEQSCEATCEQSACSVAVGRLSVAACVTRYPPSSSNLSAISRVTGGRGGRTGTQGVLCRVVRRGEGRASKTLRMQPRRSPPFLSQLLASLPAKMLSTKDDHNASHDDR